MDKFKGYPEVRAELEREMTSTDLDNLTFIRDAIARLPPADRTTVETLARIFRNLEHENPLAMIAFALVGAEVAARK